MTIQSKLVRVDQIDDSNRLRPIDPSWAQALAASMDERGQDQPIVIRPLVGTGRLPFELVAGGHRLAAVKLLGWGEIRAEERELDADQARLLEIDENLVRHELTPLDRAFFLRERKSIWERLFPEVAHGGDRRSKQKAKTNSPSWRLGSTSRFTAEAAERCGFSERTVQRAVELADKLSPAAVRLIRETDLARNASALAELAAEEPESQIHLSALIASGEAKTVKEARILAGRAPTGEGDPQELAFRKLVAAWDRAGKEARGRFLVHAGLISAGQLS